MHHSRQFATGILSILTVAGILAVLDSGCATRKFVRNEVGQLRQDMTQQVEGVRTETVAARNSADEALSRAEMAVNASGEARELALGKAGYHDVGLYTVNFAFDSDELDEASQSVLGGVAETIRSRPEVLVDVYGFADPTGADRYNLGLGERRAQSVMRYLAAQTPGQLSRYAALSYGEKDPNVTSEPKSREERAKARKVVVSLVERIPLTGGTPPPTAESYR